MKYYFLLLFLITSISLIGFIPNSQAETYRGADFSLTTNPDGSYTRTLGLPTFINSNNSFVPFVFTDDTNFLIVETEHGSVKLHKSSCAFEYYSNGYISIPEYDEQGNIIQWTSKTALFSDSIVPLMATNGTMNYNIIDSINNESCVPSWDGSQLTASKLKAGVGLMEYKYILNDNSWKTQLEATNLSSQTDKLFGFTQTINLNRDTINYGGSQKNLDNYNNTSFNRTWLENNDGKVIDLLNGFNFDFDLSFDNLYQVNVFDTGVNSSKLSFDYVYNQSIILPGETLIIDPTFGNIGADSDFRIYSDNPSSGTCVGRTFTGWSTSGWVEYGNVNFCSSSLFEYDTTWFPNNGVPTALTFTYDIASTTITVNCVLRELDTAISAGQTTYDESMTGTKISDPFSSCQSNGTGKTVSFNAGGVSDFATKVSSQAYYGISVMTDPVTTPDGTKGNVTNGLLSVTYNLPPDPPKQAGGSVSGANVLLTWLAGALNGDTHSTYEVERLNLDGSTWDELVSQSAVDYTDLNPQYNATAKYRIWDTGALGRGCSQFVMNSTTVASLQSHFPFCYTVNDNGILDNDITVTAGNELYANSTGIISFDFDKTTQLTVPVETDYDFDRTDPFSFFIKFKTTNTTTDQYLISKGNPVSSNPGWVLYMASSLDRVEFQMYGVAEGLILSCRSPIAVCETLNDGNWHTYALSKGTGARASDVTVWIDNVETTLNVQSDTLTSTSILNNLNFEVGAKYDGTNFFDGNIAEIMFFDIELDANQQDQLYLERIDTSNLAVLPGTPTLSATALSDTALRYTSVPGIAGDNPTIWYALQCELNGAGSWSSTVTNSSYVSFYEYTGLVPGDVNICQWRDGSVDGWGLWSNNATDILALAVLTGQRTIADTDDKLFQFINFITAQGGVYFGLGALPFGVMLLGFLAGKKTVRIFTLATLFLMGIIHASGYYVYPDWYWTLSILFGIVLIMGRMKSD